MSAHSSTGDGHDQVASTHARLFWALGGTLAFSIVEALAGWRSGSLALLADAGHMVTDGAALGLAAFAAWLAALPPTERHSYGWGRVELLAALVNALAMLAVVLGIGVEAWSRLESPVPIEGAMVSGVAALGLLVIWRSGRGCSPTCSGSSANAASTTAPSSPRRRSSNIPSGS